MTEITINVIEAALSKEVQKIDKSVQVVAVEPGKKRNVYRVTLLKEGKSASADLQKDLIDKESMVSDISLKSHELEDQIRHLKQLSVKEFKRLKKQNFKS